MFTAVNEPLFPLANLVNSLSSLSARTAAPLINIAKEDGVFTISIVAPGFAKEDFAIDIDGQRLRVSASVGRGQVTPEGDQPEAAEAQVSRPTYVRREFVQGDFERTFNLPETIDAEAITASHANGILTLRLPTRIEARLQRTVAIG